MRFAYHGLSSTDIQKVILMSWRQKSSDDVTYEMYLKDFLINEKSREFIFFDWEKNIIITSIPKTFLREMMIFVVKVLFSTRSLYRK